MSEHLVDEANGANQSFTRHLESSKRAQGNPERDKTAKDQEKTPLGSKKQQELLKLKLS